MRAGQADRALVAAIERATTEAGSVEQIALGPLGRAGAGSVASWST
jgi:hypothetical protein